MDRIVCALLVPYLLCVCCFGCRSAPPTGEATAKAMVANESDEVIIVNGPLSEMEDVSSALGAAGILHGAAGGRGVFGITVERKDAERACAVLLDYVHEQEEKWLLLYGELDGPDSAESDLK